MKLRAFILLLATGTLAVLPLGRAAFGDDQAALGGFQLGTGAVAVQVAYNQESLAIPVAPGENIAEFNLARTIATAETGPVAYGLASIAWPGSFGANAPPQIKQGLEDPRLPAQIRQAIQDSPDLPVYPVRAESFYPQGPTQQSAGVEGVRMESSAGERGSAATSAVTSTSIPNLVAVGSASSASTSTIEANQTISQAQAAAHDLDLFGGMIHFDVVASTARAVSDGVKATVEGGISFTGLTIADMTIEGQKIQGVSGTIDDKGVHIAGRDLGGPPGQALKPLTDALAQRGIAMTFAQPIDTVEGAAGSRSVDGLLITMHGSAAQPYFDMLPEQVRTQLEQGACPPSQVPAPPAPLPGCVPGLHFDQTISIIIAGVGVSASAAPAYVAPPLSTIPTAPLPPGAVPAPQVFPPPGSGTITPGSSIPGTSNLGPISLVAVSGVPLALFGVLVVWMLAGAFGLDKVAIGATSAAAVADDCPLGKS